MILYHTTSEKLLASILTTGLDPSKSKGRLMACWLHAQAQSAWAFIHVHGRHGCPIEQIVRIKVSVPRSWLKKSKRGLWYCLRQIPPERLVAVTGYREVSRSPVESEV